ELVGSLQQRLSDLQAQTSQLSERPTIGCIEWTDPLMCAGNWVPELVRIAGGRDVFGKAGEHSPYMSWDDLSREDPDVIALMPCGFDIERTHEETQVLVRDSRWQQLRAVQSGRVFLTDGNQYFNRPGPRLVESAEILAEILHPSRFNFGHEETGWRATRKPAGAHCNKNLSENLPQGWPGSTNRSPRNAQPGRCPQPNHVAHAALRASR
ncbi:MAG: hypothetical protein DWQ29_06810, partial [Planctomycetota bacterium]